MIIHGIQKMTLVDFPGKVGTILFTGSCNFRCPFCQNAALVLHPDSEPAIPDDEIFSYLRKRKGMIDGVVITGGEPTLQRDLLEYMRRIKDLGYAVKLDTNGYRPDVLRAAVEGGYADYVAMDVKNSLESYAMTCGVEDFDTSCVEETISFLKEGRVAYEFRTTVTRETHSEKNFISLASLLEGAEAYYLQNFVPNENTIVKGFSPMSYEELNNYMGILRKTIGNVQLRNI